MKFLRRIDPNAKNRQSRWVFMEGVDEPSSLADALEHPYKFRPDHIKELEQNKGELEAQQLRKLNQMAEYYVSLLADEDGKSDNVLPSRITMELYNSPLFTYINSNLQRRIEHLFSKKRSQFIDSANVSAANQTDVDVMRVTRMYNFMKARAGKFEDQDLQNALTNASGKLVSQVKDILTGYRVVPGSTRIEPVNPEVQPPLKYTQRFLILEVYRLFPQEHYWLEGKKPKETDEEAEDFEDDEEENFGKTQQEKLKLMANNSLEWVIQEMSRNAEGDRNSALLMMFWDLLDVWVEDEDEDSDLDLIISDDDRAKVQRMVERGNAAQFLAWAKSWLYADNKVLLPMHVQALKQIQEEEYQQLQPDDVREDLEKLEKEQQANDQIDKLDEEVQELQAKIDDERSKTVEKIISGGKLKESEKGAELEVRYQELQQKIKIARGKYLDPDQRQAIQTIEQELGDWSTDASIVSEPPSAGVSIAEARTVLSAGFDITIPTLERKFSARLAELKPGGELSKEEKHQVEYFTLLRETANEQIVDVDNALADIVAEYRRAKTQEQGKETPDINLVNEYTARIQKYQKEIEAFRKIKQKIQKEVDLVEQEMEKMKRLEEEIKAQVGAKESNEQQKLQKKLQELRSKHGLSDREKQILQDRYDMFADPKDNAKNLLERYNKGLSQRAREGGLYAADFAVLFFDDDEGVDGEEEIGEAIDLFQYDEDIADDEDHDQHEAHEFKQEFKEVITQFREDFDEVLEEVFDEVTVESLAIPSPREISDGDRFAVWNRALDRVLGYGNIISRLGEEDREGLDQYVDFYKNRGKQVNISELLDGAIQGNRNKIIDLVAEKATEFGFEGEDDPMLREFLAQYPRFHTTLALSDSYKRLQEKRDAFAKQKAEINQDSQEVLSKIDHMFGQGSWDQIWRRIYPYISAEHLEFDDEEEALEFQNTVRARFFEVFDDEGELIDGERYFDRPDASARDNGRWHGQKGRIEDLLEDYIRSDIDAEVRGQLTAEVLRMGLHLKGKEEISQVVLEHRDILVGGEGSDLPGKETLAEAEVQLYPIRDAMRLETTSYNNRLEVVEAALRSNPESGRVELQALLLEGERVLVPALQQHLDSAQELLKHVIPDKPDFVNAYIDNLKAEVRLIEYRLKNYREGVASINAGDTMFDRVPALFEQLDGAFNVTEGKWKEHLDVLKDNQEKVPEAVQFLKDDLGLYGPNAETEAKQRYENFRNEYQSRFENYRANYAMVKNTLNQDIKKVHSGKMKPEEFSLMHGTTPEELQNNMRILDSEYGQFEMTWDHYKAPDFFDKWLERYKDPNRRQGAIGDFIYWGDTRKLSEQLREGSGRFVDWKEQYDKQKEQMKKMGPRIEFRMISLNALFQMCKDSFELAGRRIERRIERDKAFLGSSIFGEKGIFGLGYEWERKRTEDEEKRVEEFKNQYKRMDMWKKRAMLYRLGKDSADKDEVRALVDLLIDDGTMRWDDPLFWKVLNRLNKGGGPQIPDDLIDKPMGQIKIVLRQSCGALWDDYVFKNWDDALDGNHQKAVEAVKKEFADMEAMGGREDVLVSMLDKWKRGEEDETVSPERFEGLLRAAYDAGKMNGTPDKRWFYLIMGMTVKNGKTGMTLISRTMLDRLDESLLSRMPYFDFFTDKTTPKKDGWIVSPETPGAKTGPWEMSDIMKWGEFFGSDGRYGFDDRKNPIILKKCNEFFYNNVVESDNALMRVDRMARAGIKEADHDDGEMWFAGLSIQSITQLLNRSSAGTDQISPDLATIILNGFGHYMRATYEFVKSGDETYGPDNSAWKVQKEKRLGRASELIRVAFAGLQTLSGNYHGTDRTEPMLAPRRFWNEDLYNINKNEERINNTMRKLLEKSGADMEDYEELWGTRCSRDIGENITTRKGSEKYKRINKTVAKILTGQEDGDLEGGSSSSVFEDLNLIQNIVMDYGQEHGGVTGNWDQDSTTLLYKEDRSGGRLEIGY